MCILVVRYLFRICLRNKYIITLSDLANIVRDKAKINPEKGGGRRGGNLKENLNAGGLQEWQQGCYEQQSLGDAGGEPGVQAHADLDSCPTMRTVKLWACGFTLLDLRFLTCKMGLRSGPTPRRISGNP